MVVKKRKVSKWHKEMMAASKKAKKADSRAKKTGVEAGYCSRCGEFRYVRGRKGKKLCHKCGKWA